MVFFFPWEDWFSRYPFGYEINCFPFGETHKHNNVPRFTIVIHFPGNPLAFWFAGLWWPRFRPTKTFMQMSLWWFEITFGYRLLSVTKERILQV